MVSYSENIYYIYTYTLYIYTIGISVWFIYILYICTIYIYIYHEESTSIGSERAGLYLPALPALPVSLAPLAGLIPSWVELHGKVHD